MPRRISAALLSATWLASHSITAVAQDETRTPGRWYHVGERDPFDDAYQGMYAAIYPDSITGAAHLRDPVPLRVACEDGKRIRIHVFGPTPHVTDPAGLTGPDHTPWNVRFSDGKIWKRHLASVYPSTTPGRHFVQAAWIENEMTQHLIASRWAWISYPTWSGEQLIAWYTLPQDTESSLTRIYKFCKKTMPSHRAAASNQPDTRGPTGTSGLLSRP